MQVTSKLCSVRHDRGRSSAKQFQAMQSKPDPLRTLLLKRAEVKTSFPLGWNQQFGL